MAITQGGIAFTFYDSSRWSYFRDYYPLMQKIYPDWKATFFADQFGTVSDTVKNEMLAAQTAGMCFGNHQYLPNIAYSYSLVHGEQRFYDDVVKPQQDAMIAWGFNPPRAFAYADGEAPRTISNLILTQDTELRIVMLKTYGIFDNPANSRGYYKKIYSQGIGGIGHEDINSDVQSSAHDVNYIIDQLEYCKDNNDVYIHSGHNIGAGITGDLSNLHSTIHALSRYCACNGLRFYTMNELGDAGFVGSELQYPSISNIIVTGTQSSGNNLTAVRTYQDDDDTVESGTTFQWYRADDAIGTNAAAIGGATALIYTLTGSDTGKYVRLGIIPRTATQTGYETFTKWYAIA